MCFPHEIRTKCSGYGQGGLEVFGIQFEVVSGTELLLKTEQSLIRLEGDSG